MKKMIGALTDKLYAFKHRCWELLVTNSIDIFDSFGSNIKIYTYGSEVKRILPLKNDFINEEWISNKTRYFFEGLTKWRINIPLIKKFNVMSYVSWLQALYFFSLKLWFHSFFDNSEKLFFLNSLFVDYELIITSKILIKKLGFFSFNKKMNININDYFLYYLNPNFFEKINSNKLFIFLGYNLRLESPILNIKLRKKSLNDTLFYCTIGSNFNDNLNSIMLGLNLLKLIKYLQGKLKICSSVLKHVIKVNNDFSNSNMFLLGNNIINRLDSKQIFYIINKYCNILSINYTRSLKYLSPFLKKFCEESLIYCFSKKKIDLNTNLNVLNINLTTVLYDELNLFLNTHNVDLISKNDILYLLGCDFLKLKKSQFIIFQGHHLNLDFFNVNLIFPSTTFLEKSGNFLNIEGNLLQTNFILYPPIFCRDDWSILNSIYISVLNFVNNIYKIKFNKSVNFLNVNRFYLSLNSLKKILFFLKNLSVNFYFKEFCKYKKYFYNIVMRISTNYLLVNKIYNSIISNIHYNMYDLNIISRNSSILKQCSKNLINFIRSYQNININVWKKNKEQC